MCAYTSVVVSCQASLEIYRRSFIRIMMQIFTSIVLTITENDFDSLSGACSDILMLQIQRGFVKSRDLITLQRTAE